MSSFPAPGESEILVSSIRPRSADACTQIVLMASSLSNPCPLLERVCLYSVTSSRLLNPIVPSLYAALRKIVGYAVRSAPSAFSGRVLYTFVSVNDARPLDLIVTLSLARVSLALSTSRYLVSLLTISKPRTYALPAPTVATSLSAS